MNVTANQEIEAWEGEGGAGLCLPGGSGVLMSGTPSQVEWAQRIRLAVNADFDRVAASFHEIAHKQNATRRGDTEAIIAILEDKRAEVMTERRAGYFIHEWQEIGDQVRQMIFDDARYQAIKNTWPATRP